MNENQTIQALRLTIQDLSANLVETMATKHLLSIQLTEAQQTIADLQSKKEVEE